MERITFIPPASNYYRSQFYIFPRTYIKLNRLADYTEVPRNDNPYRKTKVYSHSYSKESSPLLFRNFLTFSFSEDFNTEFYVDNEFYISEIKEMVRGHFEQYQYDKSKKGKWYIRDKNGNPIYIRPFKKESSFYIFIPKKGSVECRK